MVTCKIHRELVLDMALAIESNVKAHLCTGNYWGCWDCIRTSKVRVMIEYLFIITWLLFIHTVVECGNKIMIEEI